MNDYVDEDSESVIHEPDYEKPLLNAVKQSFLDGEFSDLVIECDGRKWAVHKMIVCRLSDFFRACCKNFKEANEGIVHLPDDDKYAVDSLLEYLYTADYDPGRAVEVRPPLLHHVFVYHIADKYGLSDLRRMVASKFQEDAEHDWKTPAFAQAIQEMYTTNPDSMEVLHQIAARVTIANAKALYNRKDSLFYQVACDVAPFAAEVSFQLLADRIEEPVYRYKCPSCRSIHSRKGEILETSIIACGSCGDEFCGEDWIVNRWFDF